MKRIARNVVLEHYSISADASDQTVLELYNARVLRETGSSEDKQVAMRKAVKKVKADKVAGLIGLPDSDGSCANFMFARLDVCFQVC